MIALLLFLLAWSIMGYLTAMSTILAINKKYLEVITVDYDITIKINIILRLLAFFILWPYFATSEDFAINFLIKIKNLCFVEKPNLN